WIQIEGPPVGVRRASTFANLPGKPLNGCCANNLRAPSNWHPLQKFHSTGSGRQNSNGLAPAANAASRWRGSAHLHGNRDSAAPPSSNQATSGTRLQGP